MGADEYGQILDVSTINQGTVFAASAIIGATTLTLADVSAFEEAAGKVYIDGVTYDYTTVTQAGATDTGTAPAIEIAIGETSWSTSTTPKTVVMSSCVTGDWLAVIAGGDALSGSPVTAATSSTTAGTTTAWSELAENLTVGTGQEWYHAATAQVTADGSVTVQVARTQSGAGQWGFLVVRGRNCNGVALLGEQGTPGSGQTITGAPSAGATVVTGFFDWDVSNPPTGWTPAGQTVIESAEYSDYTIAAAYWTNQSAGFRAYGTTNFNSNELKGVGLELQPQPATAVASSPTAGTMTLLTGLTAAAVADETRVEIYPPAPIRTALVALALEEAEAVRVTIPYYVDLPDGTRSAGQRENVLIEEPHPGELHLKDIVAKGMVLLGTGENLDDYTSAGNFMQLSSNDAAAGSNYPVPYAGVLEVLATRPEKLMAQRYTAWRNSRQLSHPSSWVRTFGADVWSAWMPEHDDTGWVSSIASVAVASTGWTIDSADIRRINKTVHFRVWIDRTGADITVPVHGDIADSDMFQFVAEWRPGGTVTQGVITGSSGRTVAAAVTPDGTVVLTAVGAGSNISATFAVGGTYLMD